MPLVRVPQECRTIAIPGKFNPDTGKHGGPIAAELCKAKGSWSTANPLDGWTAPRLMALQEIFAGRRVAVKLCILDEGDDMPGGV